jgi:MFS family permease
MTTLEQALPPPGRDWQTISLVSLAHGGSHFSQLIVPPLFPWIGPAFGLSNTELGALLSVFFVVSGVGQALAGFVVDRHGPERVLFGGLALLALAALGLGASPTYAAMLVFMAVAGLGNCVFHPVDFSILNARVQAQRLGHAYAAHGISGSLGWALAPAFVVAIAAVSSWRWALLAAASVIAGVLALLWWQRSALNPAAPDAGAAAARGHKGRGASEPAGSAASLSFLRLPAVWACFVFFLVAAVALGAMQSFAPAAASHLHGVSAEQVALSLSAYMVAAAGGMVLGGHLVRDARRSAHIAALGFGAAGLLALALGLGNWPPVMVPVLCALMGLGSGIAGPSRDLLVKQATPPGATGRVYGVVYSGLDVGMTVAPLIFGALMDAGRYRSVWVGVALLFGLLILTAFNVRRSAPRIAAATAAP